MQRYTPNQLYHMKDNIRFHEIYEGIVGSAKLGHTKKEIWWQSDDKIDYLISQIKWYFCEPIIENQSDHIIVIWDPKAMDMSN